MENSDIYASHLEARSELMKMQKCGGAMINPFVFYNIILINLSEEEKNNYNQLTFAREIATTFCAICNEYYIIYCNEHQPKTEFYITEDRWAKYFISSTSRDISIKFLQRIGLIACDTKTIPPDNKSVTTYKIKLETLQSYRRMAEEYYKSERAKRIPE